MSCLRQSERKYFQQSLRAFAISWISVGEAWCIFHRRTSAHLHLHHWDGYIVLHAPCPLDVSGYTNRLSLELVNVTCAVSSQSCPRSFFYHPCVCVYPRVTHSLLFILCSSSRKRQVNPLSLSFPVRVCASLSLFASRDSLLVSAWARLTFNLDSLPLAVWIIFCLFFSSLLFASSLRCLQHLHQVARYDSNWTFCPPL